MRTTPDSGLERAPAEPVALLKLHRDAQRLLRPMLVVNPFARDLVLARVDSAAVATVGDAFTGALSTGGSLHATAHSPAMGTVVRLLMASSPT